MPVRIGITTYGRAEDDNYTLPANYVDALRRAGADVVLLPPGGACEPSHWLAQIDGLVLAGGGDIDPSCYAGTSHDTMYMTDLSRDGTELALTKSALESGLPLLCICRGLQVANVALGGTLVGHVPDQKGTAVAHRTAPRRPAMHDIVIEPQTLLASVVGEGTLWSASWHHQAVDELAPNLRVSARAPDGMIEGLELREPASWMLAVQWHPELTAEEDPRQQALFNRLVEAASGQQVIEGG